MDYDDPFITVLSLDSNTEEEIEVECEMLMLRQAAIQQFSKGLITGNLSKGEIVEFADLLAETGVDPNQYAQTLGENLNFVVAANIPINTNGLGCFRW